MLPGAQEISAGVAQPLLLNPRAFAGSVAILVAGLLLLLFFYRRRRYILCWAAGWMLGALSMLVTLVVPRPEFAPFVYGVSQFFGIVSALVFVVSADAYRSRPRFRRGYALGLLPILIWFTLVPLALKRMDTVFAPGHLLIGSALGAAGIAHIGLLRDLRMLGAFLCGCMLLVTGGTHLWIAYSISTPNAGALSQVMLLLTVVFIFTALGMQLMTFEDMTYELRVTNRRLESAQGELRQMVTTDPLTGCRNRRYFDDVIGREIQRHRRYRIPLSIMFIDIDHFKAVNDTLGHEAGDGVLKTVAAFLVKNVREADYVFRWGGDEFLILISCREEKALRKGAELREVFALSEEIAALPKGVGLSIGVVEVPQDVTDIVPLIKLADDRMYMDKRRSAS